MQKLADISFFESLCSSCCSSLGVFNDDGNLDLADGTDVAPEADITKASIARGLLEERLKQVQELNRRVPTFVVGMHRKGDPSLGFGDDLDSFVTIGGSDVTDETYVILSKDYDKENPPVYIYDPDRADEGLRLGAETFDEFVTKLRRLYRGRNDLLSKVNVKHLDRFPFSGQFSVLRDMCSNFGQLSGTLGGGVLGGVLESNWNLAPILIGLLSMRGGALGSRLGSWVGDWLYTEREYKKALKTFYELERRVLDGSASEEEQRKYHDIRLLFQDWGDDERLVSQSGEPAEKLTDTAAKRTMLRILEDNDVYGIDLGDIRDGIPAYIGYRDISPSPSVSPVGAFA